MNHTVVDERAAAEALPPAGAVISGRSLLLRLMIAIVTVAVLSIGGAWLMYTGIDPAAEAAEGVETSTRDTSAGAPPTGR
jgi:hypothetical protein